MTWPFENDTGTIVKKLARRSLASEKRRNLMVVIAVALAAFLISFAAILSVSVAQIQRNQVADTYEAVFTGVEASDVAALKDLPELARVGEYYLLGQEHSEQGYNASYVYCDSDMIHIARSQMELVKGELPVRANEVAVSEYFLSAYGSNAKIGERVRLDTESFQGDYIVTGILSNVGEKEVNVCAIAVSKAALTQWAGFDPAGYRAYVHFQNAEQLSQEVMTSCCREIAAWYGLPHVGMNSSYFAYASKSIDFAATGGVAALALIGGYVVIQSIFRISVQDKIQSYGQLRTIGATSKQIRRIVKRESRRPGSVGISLGVLLGVLGRLLLFPRGFHGAYYGLAVLLTVLACWFMVSVSVRRPVKIAAGISPLEAARFSAGRERIRGRKKCIRLNPVSMGLANFLRDRKKAVNIAASLGLGGILLLIVSSAVLTRSPEQAARLYFPDGDYKIYLSSEQPEEEIMAAGNPLNDGLRREIHPEIESFDYSWSIVSDPKKAERVEAGLQEILSGHSNLGLDTIGVHIEYEKMQSGLIFGGLRALSWLIFLFGVVNLINTTLSNQMSRKRENSILRSVGLTGKQLCRMNICEGLCYAAFAALAVLLIGLPIAVVVCREVSRQSFAGEIVPYQFPILEMGLFLLVLFGLEFLLSAWTASRQRKQSLVEQMRAVE